MFSVVPKEEEKDFSSNQDMIIVQDGVPLSPDWMGYEARMEWMRSAPELYKKGQLVGGNIALFENFCVAVGLTREFEAMLANDGKIINGKPHPAFKMMLDAMAQAKSIATELKFGKEIKPESEEENEEQESKSKWNNGLLA